LSGFLADLAAVWIEPGLHKEIRVGTVNKIVDYFVHGSKDLLCIWRDNCVNDFVYIDPVGQVVQCDCSVTRHPEFHFGNVLVEGSLMDLLLNGEACRRLQTKPGEVVRKEDCPDCKYLALCHVGCPIRAYTVCGDVFRKDPYFELYRRLFQHMEELTSGSLNGGPNANEFEGVKRIRT